ncbi:hypothetical protein CCACVL1_04970 [Corchorus capsularis]|uniref:Uncharacterized protein n=1 Tax=Corchorus capsularis TaxID=210143 RepID=A0A1R3JNK9_COCAP|nr:hypothetical protein CCACVL1_04970 [Corchorus capsularis]
MAPPTAAFSAPSCPKLAQPSGFSGLRKFPEAILGSLIRQFRES